MIGPIQLTLPDGLIAEVDAYGVWTCRDDKSTELYLNYKYPRHKYIDSPSTGEHLSGEAAIKAADDLGGILDWPPLPATDPTIVY